MRRLILIGVLVTMASVLGGQTMAKATKTPFTGTLTYTSIGDPERRWMSGNVLHARGQVNSGSVTGGLVGTATVIANYNFNLVTGVATQWGTFVVATEERTWEGAFRGKFTATANVGSFVGQGTDGSKIRGDFVLAGAVMFALEGTILDPNG
jgi:hypothetical protein